MDTVRTKRRMVDAVDRFSALPVALLHVIFRFCLLKDLLHNVTVCKAWAQWISDPAALPAEPHHSFRLTEPLLDWLGRCGVRWSRCGLASWIDRGPYPAETVTETWLSETDIVAEDTRGDDGILHRCRDRLRLTTLRWQGGDRGGVTPAQWEKARFLLSGLQTLISVSLVPATLLSFCEALHSLRIELRGDVDWIPLIRAAPNQQFRIHLRIDSDRSAVELLDVVTRWCALRDRLDEVTLVTTFRDEPAHFRVDRDAFTQIQQMQLPLVRLYVTSKSRMVKMSASDMPQLRELYWNRWHVCGRAHVESFLRLLNAVYVE